MSLNLYKYHTQPSELIYGTKQYLAIPSMAYDMLKANDFSRSTKEQLERIIIKDPRLTYLYSMYTINGRWSEAEPTLMKDPHYAFMYAKFVMNSRWKEAESYIRQDSDQWNYYSDHFNIN